MAENQVKITLTRSLIGSNPKQRATAKSIGLRKIGNAALYGSSLTASKFSDRESSLRK